MTKRQFSADDLIFQIIKGIDAIKGNDVKLLDLRDIENSVCDYFVICSGSSNTQVNAIAESVKKVVSKQLKNKPWSIEGQNNGRWILIDYLDVVVHIFQDSVREFYDLESLWGDAVITSKDLINS